MKTARLARATAAGFLGIALGATAFAEEFDSGILNRQAQSGVGVSPEKVASRVQLVSQIAPVRNLIQVGGQDNNRWKIKLAAEIRKHLQVEAPDLVTGYEVLREVTSERGIERAIGRLSGYWEQASPGLRARILVITGDMVAELIPEMEMLAGTAAAGLRERMETRSSDLVPLYDKILHELRSEPAIGNLVAQAGSEFRKTTPEMRGRIIELVGTLMIDLMIQIEKG